MITEYKGIQVETTLNDIVFKPLARSEDDRANYFPDIILDGNSIVIEVQNEYKISGIIVEYNSLTRHMTFGVEDLAYTCDIVALDKKINALAETSHTNDALMASIQDTYTTVDEVNEVLTHYVLKSEVINKYVPTNTFSGYVKSADEKYRQKDDLSVNMIVNLPIEHKTPTHGDYEFQGETAFVEFHEGALLEGYAIVYDAGIKDYVHRDFSITFHTDWIDGERHASDIIISSDVQGFWWEERTNMFYASGDIDIAVHINSAKLYVEDTFALKSEIEVLKTTISSLEARLAALENK